MRGNLGRAEGAFFGVDRLNAVSFCPSPHPIRTKLIGSPIVAVSVARPTKNIEHGL
jgi:hypothetical protein